MEVTAGKTTDTTGIARAHPRNGARQYCEGRIANELLLKLGIRVSHRTVRKYLPKRPRGQPLGDQRWSTFVHNHAKTIVACNFRTVVTATFKTRYVLVIIEL